MSVRVIYDYWYYVSALKHALKQRVRPFNFLKHRFHYGNTYSAYEGSRYGYTVEQGLKT